MYKLNFLSDSVCVCVSNPISRSFTPVRLPCICNLVLLSFLLCFLPTAFRACGISSETGCGILYICPFVPTEWVGSFIRYQRAVTHTVSSVEVGMSLTPHSGA